MKNRDIIGQEKYTVGELAQLSRRRMVQKDHEDKSKYKRKQKHNKDDFDNFYPDQAI